MMFPFFETFNQKFGNLSGDSHREDCGDDAKQDEKQDVSLENPVDGENPDARRQEEKGESLEKEVGHLRDLIDLDDFRTK